MKAKVKSVWVALLAGGLLALAPAVWAHPMHVDQHNDGFTPSLYESIQASGPMGQEFTPAMSSLDSVELHIMDLSLGGVGGGNLITKIRAGTIAGALLGTSEVLSLPDGFKGVAHLDFASSVALTPGNLYVIEAIVQTGVWGIGSSGGPSPAYPGGRQIIEGAPTENNDLWFREGPIVPEPAGLGLIGLAMMVVRRRRT